ncbi:MAG: NAD(P)H-hydrate dehydratase [Defluviitaleaceae bacterium]|nr:NAD(P)H-hydrate dehydratase [Defluviitaleaceae bacterium]
MYIVKGHEMRELENRAMKKYAIPSVLLMENAALQVVKNGLRLLNDRSAGNVTVVCGSGNNGGDGLASARLFYTKGHNVRVAYIGDISKAQGDVLINLRMVQQMGIPIEADPEALPELVAESHLVVDALLGIGLSGPLRPNYARAINAINTATVPVLSVDIPSGVDADTGKVMDTAVHAHTTVTFGLAKIGLMAYPGAEYAGQVIIEDISLPAEALSPPAGDHWLQALCQPDIAALLPKRPARSNKGTFGRMCVIAGCREMPGAAVLCCKAAYKAGAGLVHACVVWDVAKVIQSYAHEVITTILPEILPNSEPDTEAVVPPQADVIAIGPGLGRNPESFVFVRKIMNQASVPLVIDADGLMAIADDITALKSIKVPCVITPHPGEMAALTKLTTPEVTGNLIAIAQEFAKTHGIVTLLKDARTVIASPDGRTFINLTGTPALAKAGTGDVLTGVIAALIAQGLAAFDAAVLAAYVHGFAGELAAKSLSVYGVNASDLLEYLPYAFML